MNRIKKLLCLGLCVYLFNSIHTGIAENIPNPKIIIPTVTLLVKKYGDLEKSLQEAILQADVKKINTYLSTDFEERKGVDPNSPIPRETWIQTIKNGSKINRIMQQIAVRDLGNILIVSYLSVMPNKNDENIFIVDAWKIEGEKSELMVRYSSIVPHRHPNQSHIKV